MLAATKIVSRIGLTALPKVAAPSSFKLFSTYKTMLETDDALPQGSESVTSKPATPTVVSEEIHESRTIDTQDYNVKPTEEMRKEFWEQVGFGWRLFNSDPFWVLM